MTVGFLFWLLVILWVIFGFYWNWPVQADGRSPHSFAPLGGNLLLFVLLVLLGIGIFGWPIKG